MPELRTVICDLGGVYFTDGSARAIVKISHTYDIPVDRVRDVLMGDLGSRYRFGEISEAAFWEAAMQSWDLQITTHEIAPIWLRAYEPMPGTVALIDRLRAAVTRCSSCRTMSRSGSTIWSTPMGSSTASTTECSPIGLA